MCSNVIDGKLRDLLMEAQYDFPITNRPFLELANRIGVSEDWVIDSLRRLKEQGVVRRIGALVNYRARGMVSALVALRVNEDAVDLVASEVNKDKYVTHNFLRSHSRYNMWYVTKAMSREELNNKVMNIVDRFRGVVTDYVILYAERTYKIDVKFDLYRGVSRAKVRRLPDKQYSINDVGLPMEFYEYIKSIRIMPEPFNDASVKFNIPVGKMAELISDLRDKGIIRDFYAMIDPELSGFRFNAMVVFNTDNCEAIADIDEATHVVKRITVPGKWDYNCYFMIHATSQDIIRDVVSRRLSGLGIVNYDLLYSIRNLLPDMARRIEA